MQANEAIARYALDGLPDKVLAAESHTVLPDEKLLAKELAKTRREWEAEHPVQSRILKYLKRLMLA